MPFHGKKKNQSINVTKKKSPDPDGSQDSSSKCLKNQCQFYTTSSENREASFFEACNYPDTKTRQRIRDLTVKL